MEETTQPMTTTFQTNRELHKQFKVICINNNKSISDTINELIKEYVKKHGKK